ncbi:MAG: DUF421 domain-containing protein [Bacillota bacterium]|jgi:uncharacterized membrane protein YcaP (DUF421 family)
MNPYLEIILRSLGAFVLVIVITRLVGKSQMGKLTVADFVNAIVIGSIAAALVVELQESAVFYALGLVLFGLLTWSSEFMAMKYRPARKILEGEPTIVIHNGKILEKNMGKMTYHVDDLTMQLREKNVFNISDVEFAVAEPNGELSVLLKSQKLQLTPHDLQIPTRYQGVPSELVVDGQIIQQNLRQNNLTRDWLMLQLAAKGVNDVKKVTLASLDSQGNLYVDTIEDAMDYTTDISD